MHYYAVHVKLTIRKEYGVCGCALMQQQLYDVQVLEACKHNLKSGAMERVLQ